MRIRIKVCGITNPDDAIRAVEAGVDAIGLVFFSKSPRALTAHQAREITSELPPFVSSVGVFVNENLEQIRKVQNECGLDVIQLHGDESPEFCQVFYETFNTKIIKAFSLKNQNCLDNVASYEVDAFLFDAFSPSARGGTGECFDWDWIEKTPLINSSNSSKSSSSNSSESNFSKSSNSNSESSNSSNSNSNFSGSNFSNSSSSSKSFIRPIIIAGGLNPENVAACVRATCPYGLDVSSGVERVIGRKDFVKMRAFVQATQEAASAISPRRFAVPEHSKP